MEQSLQDKSVDKLVKEQANHTAFGALWWLLGFYAFAVILFVGICYSPYYRGVPFQLRFAMQFNDKLTTLFFSPNRLTPEFEKSEIKEATRVNGSDGLTDTIAAKNWKVYYSSISGVTDSNAYFTLAQVKALPKKEVVYDFKCVEGWSQVTWWGGTTVESFLNAYHLGKKPNGEWYKYIGFETPDGNYYVGIDMESLLQPQTLLCYELNGKPLPASQGEPLRLIIPVKYGIKHIKRIGKLFFADYRPRDFWYERGYDYYAGL